MNSLPDGLTVPLPLLGKKGLDNPLDWVSLWEDLARKGSAVLLESAGPVHEANRWVVIAGDPEKEFYGRAGQSWFGGSEDPRPSNMELLPFLDEIGFSGNPSGRDSQYSPFPFCLSGAWFGTLSYELGLAMNLKKNGPAPALRGAVPDFYFFKPRTIMAFDRVAKELYCFGRAALEYSPETVSPRQPFLVHSLKAQSTAENYKTMVEKVKNYIGKGDIYQANIAQVFTAHWEGNPGSLYRLLKEMNPGPFMGLYQGRGFTVVSSSPERLAAGHGDWLETRPIAGTRPRGQDEIRDLQLLWELKTNPKEQAEHLMLVDLARNDLGKIAEFGTVEVKSFAGVESYAKVHHLVSIVQARRGQKTGVSEILKALFPGGTITGCPKIRCMEIIRETEGRPRGYYTGSMGYVAPGPCFDLNILIRSFTLFPDGSLEFYAGAGIVADSNPEKEYLETLYKVEALAQALGASFLAGP